LYLSPEGLAVLRKKILKIAQGNRP